MFSVHVSTGFQSVMSVFHIILEHCVGPFYMEEPEFFTSVSLLSFCCLLTPSAFLQSFVSSLLFTYHNLFHNMLQQLSQVSPGLVHLPQLHVFNLLFFCLESPIWLSLKHIHIQSFLDLKDD